ncbi:MAG: hypothetical protein A6F72_07025 [Cycloclasticus sp. symbiont of Poecilosclerida sp. N]|nr:MAG: hypothetical protein A6F72_07025 [Cycloclasticus sp. symbiont of Poecilosclerida sp. N]
MNEANQRLAIDEQFSGEKPSKDNTKDLVGLKQVQTQVQISAKVAQIAGVLSITLLIFTPKRRIRLIFNT